MEITRKTDIFVETKRKFVIHQAESTELLFCARCPGQMMTAEAAAVLFDISRRAVYRFIENEKVHFSETDAGIIFVCPDSFGEIIPDAG